MVPISAGTPIANDEYVLSNTMLNNTYEVTTAAVFADATFHVTDRLDLFAGLRWTREELDGDLNNTVQFAALSFADILGRYDASNQVLFADDLPVFPDGFDPTASAPTVRMTVSSPLEPALPSLLPTRSTAMRVSAEATSA